MLRYKHGYATLLAPEQFCTIKRSWKSEERCTAILSVHAPDSKKSLEMNEECISRMVEVLREGREGGARDFRITGDFNVEWCLMCTDENDNEELTKMYGPLCWQGYDKDPGGFKKNMWYVIMEEFDCKVSSTWSECGEGRAEAFHTQALSSPDKKEEISHLDHKIGPMRRNDEIYIHNAVRLWATWDHYPIFMRDNKKRHTQKSFKKGTKVDGMEADNRRSIIEFNKKK